jgi:hypothetical protein
MDNHGANGGQNEHNDAPSALASNRRPLSTRPSVQEAMVGHRAGSCSAIGMDLSHCNAALRRLPTRIKLCSRCAPERPHPTIDAQRTERVQKSNAGPEARWWRLPIAHCKNAVGPIAPSMMQPIASKGWRATYRVLSSHG